MSEDEKTGKRKSVAKTDAEKLSAFIEKSHPDKPLKVAIFTHQTPDPDSIASFVAMRHLLSYCFDLEADCFFDGDVSHPQNKTSVQLLEPDMRRIVKYQPGDYFMRILVDTIPTNAGTGDHEVDFDLVIDHHKEQPGEDFKGLCLHHHSGSCAGIIHEMLNDLNVEWRIDDESHVKIASAILVGVLTDTDFCTKPDTTYRDFKAQQNMSQYSDHDIIRKIVRFNWPMSWVKLMGTAITDHIVQEGVAVVGLGMLESDQKDAVAAIADLMLTWGNIQTAVAFAFFDHKFISASVRTVDPAIEVHALCDTLGGKYGHGGGKSLAGRYYKPLGAFEFDHEEEQSVMDRWWQLQKEREISKILKLLNK